MILTILVVVAIALACFYAYRQWNTCDPSKKLRKEAMETMKEKKKGSIAYVKAKEVIRTLDALGKK